MHHLGRNIALIAVVLLLCLWSIFPVEKKLRLGKDLAGGVSLIYTVEVDPKDPPDVIDRTIEVLKDRLDPRGLYELSMNQVGRDRIEISFPLPNERVKELRARFEAELQEFSEYYIDPDALQRALRETGDERIESLRALAGDSEARAALLQPVIDAAEKTDEARRAYQEAKSAGAEQEKLDELLAAAADAELELEERRDQLIEAVVSPDELREALELSDSPIRVLNDETGDVEEMPSPRERAMSSIRERLDALPGAAEQLDRVADAFAEYAEERTGFDDPGQVVRLLQGAGVLDFRIAVAPNTTTQEQTLREELRRRGPDYVQSDFARWFKINKIEDWFDDVEGFRALREDPASYFANRYGLIVEEYNGEYYVLLHDEPGLRLTKAEGDWSVQSASPGTDRFGRPAINFQMDAMGARLLRELTEPNVGRNMAVLLDDEVYTAPSINEALSTSVQISGTFSQAELNYIIKTLNAGSLQARLGDRPISQNTLAPSLGLDNLRKGLTAAWISLIVVGVFMVFYYFFQGFIALFALACSAIIILGAMSLARAAFTLPGIAGIVLTFGMAVDANVLIYERLREELLAGNDLRTAVRIAYQKVLSTIVDANITNLIVCFVLAYTATPEIKGFAITLGIGIVATLFSALIVTRVIFTLLLDVAKVRKLRQLPMVIPAIDRFLTPRLDFVGLRKFFVPLSLLLIGGSFYLMYHQGEEMLGTEFRGGTEISIELTPDAEPMTRSDVETRIAEIAATAEQTALENPEQEEARILSGLINAAVIAVNPEDDGVTSKRFKITTTIAEDPATEVSEQNVLRDAIVSKFSDVVDSRPALSFEGAEIEDSEAAPVYQVIDPVLGRNIGMPEVQNDVERFVGGTAILLEDFAEPLPSKENLQRRIEYMRAQPDFAQTLRRPHELIVLEGSNEAVRSAVLLTIDPAISFFTDEQRWRTQVAEQEWNLVRSALTESTTLAGVQSFSPAIAATFKAQAIVAVSLSFLLILGYIWFRFGSIRYSLAAIIALVHDVIIAIGLIALAEILYYNFPAVGAIGIQPFKIDLGLVAAILTIIGYSLNDTIIILDRVRENRGKLAYVSREVVNSAISQTLSRTIITSGTTLMAVGVMFVIGGEGIASFTYALLCGIVVGTYSTVAVAAPMVYTKNVPAPSTRHRTPDAAQPPQPGEPTRATA